jgi:hypothetical protein
MQILTAIIGFFLIGVILLDCFETIVLPRRIARKYRLTRLFFRSTWWLTGQGLKAFQSYGRRKYLLSFYGPLSLILLLAFWAMTLITAFALVQWSLGSALSAPEKQVTFFTDLYMSGTTFFTLGLGDVTPRMGLARALTVIEAGLGFGFLALVIGYLPVIYQTFSRREAQITLLDARAGSPPSASEFLRRQTSSSDPTELVSHLREWEHWCSELLESHLSYPVLMYYRSQHDNQSWIAALTTLLDVSALVMLGLDGIPEPVGRFTFAIARHAAVDLAQSLGIPPVAPKVERLSAAQFAELQEILMGLGLYIHDEETAHERLQELQALYEPYVNTLAHYLFLRLPSWMPDSDEIVDDWQTSAWDHFTLTSQRPPQKKFLHKIKQGQN